jgi:hypothetical protein
MSINGAVIELDKEIERLSKEIERVTKIRSSLLQGTTAGVSQPVVKLPTVSQLVAPKKRKYVRAAKAVAKLPVPAKKSFNTNASIPTKAVRAKTPSVKTTAVREKRVISAVTRKKMSDAAKARTAAKAAAAK